MKERNITSGTCTRCKKFVAPRSGWIVKGGFGARYLYHAKCLDLKNEEDKRKLEERLKTANKFPKNGG